MNKPLLAATPAAKVKRAGLSLCLLMMACTANAAPMGFKGSWMAMGDLSTNWREGWVNYAFTARDAVGAGAVYMRSDDKQTNRTLSEATYTRLVQRWNLAHAQANVWFF